jgi:GT2 family glycosyltransferase
VVLIPRSLIERHGFLDPSWFLYGEEIDYGFRLRAAGAPTFLVPGAVVHHTGGGSSRARPAVAELLSYYRCRNELELAWRHGSAPQRAWIAAKKVLAAMAATMTGRPTARWLRRGVIDGLRRRRGLVFRPEDAWRNG